LGLFSSADSRRWWCFKCGMSRDCINDREEKLGGCELKSGHMRKPTYQAPSNLTGRQPVSAEMSATCDRSTDSRSLAVGYLSLSSAICTVLLIPPHRISRSADISGGPCQHSRLLALRLMASSGSALAYIEMSRRPHLLMGEVAFMLGGRFHLPANT